MAKRGRPPKPEESSGVHTKKYYKLSSKRDNDAINHMIQERLINAYNQLHRLAFGIDMTPRLRDKVKGML